jgi:hypothetical protein
MIVSIIEQRRQPTHVRPKSLVVRVSRKPNPSGGDDQRKVLQPRRNLEKIEQRQDHEKNVPFCTTSSRTGKNGPKP